MSCDGGVLGVGVGGTSVRGQEGVSVDWQVVAFVGLQAVISVVSLTGISHSCQASILIFVLVVGQVVVQAGVSILVLVLV